MVNRVSITGGLQQAVSTFNPSDLTVNWLVTAYQVVDDGVDLNTKPAVLALIATINGL